MKKQKVCWKITTKCNQNCKYCFGFSNVEELSYNENLKVLDNLIKNGLTDITWTGGEAVLYPNLNKLIKVAKSKGIHNKLVTNGIFLAHNNTEYVEDILNNLDEINLSIDSISNDINLALGKENNHLEIIKKVLEKTKNKEIRVGINTVITKNNINQLNELGKFLNNYQIYKWKFLKFMPVRERALENKELFETSETELEDAIRKLEPFENIENIKYKKQNDFEKSLVILPNADIIQTHKGKDFYLGNALNQEVIDFDGKNMIRKIRTVVVHDDSNIQKQVLDILRKIKDIEVVGVAKDSKDAYNKIVTLEPEMVFSRFYLMDGIDMIQKSKNVLNDKFPVFNFIEYKMPEENDFKQIYNIIGTRMNTIIVDQTEERYSGIIKDYKGYYAYRTYFLKQ